MIFQAEKRLKAAGFDPGPVPGNPDAGSPMPVHLVAVKLACDRPGSVGT